MISERVFLSYVTQIQVLDRGDEKELMKISIQSTCLGLVKSKIIAIYNSKTFKPARTTRPVHCVDSAHYTLYRGNFIKGGEYNGAQVLFNSNFNQEIFPFLPICVISPISQNTI